MEVTQNGYNPAKVYTAIQNEYSHEQPAIQSH